MVKLYSQLPTFGKVFVVVQATSPNFDRLQQLVKTDSEGKVGIYATVAEAYDAATTNSNDVILLDGWSTSHKVASMLTISKSRLHFVGMDGSGRKIGTRTLISNTGAGVAADVAMVKITGTGCSFRNIAFKNNWTVAQNVSSILDDSVQSYFENCDIESLGSAHLTNAAAASLIINGVESVYKNCTIGQQTLLATVASGQQVLISASNSARNIFEKCLFQTWTSQITHCFIRAAASSIDSSQHTFIDCEFVNRSNAGGGGVELTAAVATSATLGGRLNFSFPRIFGAADLATAAAGATGVFVVSPVLAAAASDCVGVQAS